MTTTGGSGEKFASTIHTFIEIVESPIVVQVFNNTMSLITVGPNRNLVINPMQFSYDPDVNVAAGEDPVSFVCHILSIPFNVLPYKPLALCLWLSDCWAFHL